MCKTGLLTAGCVVAICMSAYADLPATLGVALRAGNSLVSAQPPGNGGSADSSARSAALPPALQFAVSAALDRDQAAYYVASPVQAGERDVYQAFQPNPLLASVGAVSNCLGSSVALSSDGSTALIGAYRANVDGKNWQGAAYVFVRSDTGWRQQGILTAADGAANNWFGSSVALSSNTALIGAPRAVVGGNTNQGAGYVFTRYLGAWSQQAKLTAANGDASDYFGISVALSGDGNTAIAGASGTDIGGSYWLGAACVFTRSGTAWSQQAELVAADGATYDNFGSSAALSGDGNTALIGAYYADAGGIDDRGAGYVFTRTGTNWSQQEKLTASDGAAYAFFGWSAALGSDGNTALIGAYYATVGGNTGQGAAYVFTRAGTNWSQQAKLAASDGTAYDWFGWSAALGSDGNTALLGTFRAVVGGNVEQGAGYVFTRTAGAWSQQTKLTASDGAAGDCFGWSAALDGDGSTALIGAYYADVGGNVDQGAGYVFTRNLNSWSQQAKLTVCTLQFAADAYSVLEDAGSVTVTVTRTNGAGGAASVSFQTADSTATAGTDYTATSGTLIWADGNSDNQTITIPILNRAGTQSSRAFTVNLSDASGAALGTPSSATVTIDEASGTIGPTIKANGAANNVTINYPDPVSVTVAMNADIYAGVEVDWWIVAYAHSGEWYYLNSAMQWTPFSGDLALCRPVYQGALFNLSSATVLTEYILPRGTYDFWFAIDYPMDGILNPNGTILYDVVTVLVQ